MIDRAAMNIAAVQYKRRRRRENRCDLLLTIKTMFHIIYSNLI